MTTKAVARWEAKGRKRFIVLELNESEVAGTWYSYQSDNGGGSLPVLAGIGGHETAIGYMEEHVVKVLKWDFPSVKLVYRV